MIVTARPHGRLGRLSRRALVIAAALATGLAFMMPAEVVHGGTVLAAATTSYADA